MSDQDFKDKAAISAMVAFREKFDFSREQDYKDCSAMAFKLALAMFEERKEHLEVVKETEQIDKEVKAVKTKTT